MAIVHVSDLRPIYQHASDAIALSSTGENESGQSILEHIFGEQDHARSLSIPTSSRWRSWLSPAIPNSQNPSVKAGAFSSDTLIPGRRSEFGIGLDYGSSIFQLLENPPKTLNSCLSIVCHLFAIQAVSLKCRNAIHLPPDLLVAPPPFPQRSVSTPAPNPPGKHLSRFA